MSMLKDFTRNFLLLETLGVWKDISIIAFKTPTGEPIVYPPQDFTGQPTRPMFVTFDQLRMILLTFQSEKAIKIVHEFWGRSLPFRYTFELIEPKFSELESEIMNLYDLKADNATTNQSIDLPEDAKWKTSESENILSFADGKGLKFINVEKPSAVYFKLLIENHGNEVKHNQTQLAIIGITKSEIRNLIKVLEKKVTTAKLKARIKFNTTYIGGYSVHIEK